MSDKELTVDKVEEPKISFSHTSIGIFKENGLWYLSRVKYDPKTKISSLAEQVGPGDDYGTILERFKITVAKEVLPNL